MVKCHHAGRGPLAGMAVGTWSGEEDAAAAWVPRAVVEPQWELCQWAARCAGAGPRQPSRSCPLSTSDQARHARSLTLYLALSLKKGVVTPCRRAWSPVTRGSRSHALIESLTYA